MALRKVQSSLIADSAITGTTILDGSVAAVDLSSTAIADKLGYTPVSPTQLSDGLATKEDTIGYTPAPANNPTLTGTITLAGSTEQIVFDRTIGDNWIGSSVVVENGNLSIFEPPTNFNNWLNALEAGDTFTIQPGGQELTVASTSSNPFTFVIVTEEVIDETPGEYLLPNTFWITSFTQTIVGAPNVLLGTTPLDDILDAKVAKTSDTGSAVVPSGSEAQRDGSPSAGYFRFNTSTNSFEGYNGAIWGAVGGGATGGGNDKAFYLNDTVITQSYTIPNGQNAMTAGPVTLQDGVVLTVPDGSVWTVV